MTKLVSSRARSLKGVVVVPGDKSISHRSLMLGAIASGETCITGLLESADVFNTLEALRALGVKIFQDKKGEWRITGLGGKCFLQPEKPIDLGNSGTSARLLLGLLAGYPVSVTLTGDHSLSRRPMTRVIGPLSCMGAVFENDNRSLPLRITGSSNLKPLQYRLPVASAQVKSAILLAGLRAEGETIVTEPQPTRDHTERMLRLMGAEITTAPQQEGSSIVTLQGGISLKGTTLAIPADPSAAAFIVVAALIIPGSDITIPDVLVNPLRSGLYETLLEMGADIFFENRRDVSGEAVADIRVRAGGLKGVSVPASRVPAMIDEFPILAVAAAFAAGETVMTGLAELRVKESDRLAAIAAGLEAAGVTVEAGADSLRITGASGNVEGGCSVETHHDHRIAMSFLVLGMAARKPVAIDHAEMIATSFPGFSPLMNSLGAAISG